MSVYQTIRDLARRRRIKQPPVFLDHHQGMPVTLSISAQDFIAEFPLELLFNNTPVILARYMNYMSVLSTCFLELKVWFLQPEGDSISTVWSNKQGDVIVYDR